MDDRVARVIIAQGKVEIHVSCPWAVLRFGSDGVSRRLGTIAQKYQPRSGGPRCERRGRDDPARSSWLEIAAAVAPADEPMISMTRKRPLTSTPHQPRSRLTRRYCTSAFSSVISTMVFESHGQCWTDRRMTQMTRPIAGMRNTIAAGPVEIVWPAALNFVGIVAGSDG